MSGGYSNYETWNVMQYIKNNPKLHEAALRFMEREKKIPTKGTRDCYKRFIDLVGLTFKKTNQDVNWLSDKLDYATLDEEMRGLMTSMTHEELRHFLNLGVGLGVITTKEGRNEYWFVPDIEGRDTIEYIVKKYGDQMSEGLIEKYGVFSYLEDERYVD